MKTIITILLLFVAIGSNAQSVSILGNGKNYLTETKLTKAYDHVEMGLSVLTADRITAGYTIGTNLKVWKLYPNVSVSNTFLALNGVKIYIAPSASLGIKIKSLTLFAEYKYLHIISDSKGSDFIGIGIRL